VALSTSSEIFLKYSPSNTHYHAELAEKLAPLPFRTETPLMELAKPVSDQGDASRKCGGKEIYDLLHCKVFFGLQLLHDLDVRQG
jgi:hypothetical protein